MSEGINKISKLSAEQGWKMLGGFLGQGGAADVYPVERMAEPGGKKYAMKVLNERAKGKAKERFRQELKALLSVDHPGIVKVVEYAQTDDNRFQFYVMEYVEGIKNLRQRMKAGTNPFAKNALLAVEGFIEIVEALAECERRRIVHRDFDPANVLVTADDHIKLIDFGLVHLDDGERLTMTEEAVGTPHYRAPECSGYSKQPILIHADLYSAGKVLWSMVTNKEAFDREKPVFNECSLPEMLPDEMMTWHLQHLFERTIRHNIGNRFQSTGEALQMARLVRKLIREGYRPLDELATGRCPICGLAKLERKGDGPFMRRAQVPPIDFNSPQMDFYSCPVCAFSAIVDEDWLPRQQKVRKGYD